MYQIFLKFLRVQNVFSSKIESSQTHTKISENQNTSIVMSQQLLSTSLYIPPLTEFKLRHPPASCLIPPPIARLTLLVLVNVVSQCSIIHKAMGTSKYRHRWTNPIIQTQFHLRPSNKDARHAPVRIFETSTDNWVACWNN